MSHLLVLASSSPYRRRLLARLGIAFEAADPGVDERWDGGPIRELPLRLSQEKAQSLRGEYPGAFILGSDQLVVVAKQALGKPRTRDGARAQLRLLSGKSHELITAVALCHPDGRMDTRVCEYLMDMRELSDDEIERYLDADEPYDCCGSYKIEERGIALFSSVRGDDVTAIEGLPLIAVGELLRAAGFHVP